MLVVVGSVPCQGDGAVDHDFFAEARGKYLGEASKGFEDLACDRGAERFKEERFPHQRYAAADDDPPGAQQGDDMADGLSEGLYGALKSAQGEGIALGRSLGDVLPDDVLDAAAGKEEEGRIAKTAAA